MRKLSVFVAGNLIALSGASTSMAQTEAGASGLELEEIVVTAEKREVDLQKTAISIQVTSGEDLKKQGKKRLDEIMSGVVGVQSQDSQVGSSFSIRGVDTGTGGPPGTNPGATVAVLIDGVYQNRGEVVRGGTLDVSQVEVMRGTQSTNVGASAIAGAVSLVSNQPVFEYAASGSLEAGNYKKLGMEGVLNVPLTSTQALRFAYSSSKRDGYFSSNAGNEDLQTVRAKYRWQPNDDLNAVVTVEHQSIGGNGVTAGILTYNGYWEAYNSAHTYDSTMGYPAIFGHVNNGVTFRDRSNPWDDGYPADVWPNNPFRDTQISSYTANVDWNAGIGTLTVIPAVQHTTFRSAEPPRDGSWMAENRVQDTRQFEARLASPASSKVQWLGGVYYYYTNLTGTFESISNPGVGMGTVCPTGTGASYCYNWDNAKEGSQTTKSVYGNITYPVIDSLRLLASARYTHDDKVNTQSADTSFADSTATGPTCDLNLASCAGYGTAKGSWSAVTYRAGVEYDLLPQSMVYATYATGYQPGSTTLDSMSSPPVAGTPTVKNTTTQFTLGIKNKFFDNRLQLNLEAFQLKFKDRPFNDPTSYTVTGSSDNCNAPPGTPSGLIVGANLGCINPNVTNIIMPNQKSQGVDMDLSFLITASDRLDATFEYLDSTYGANPTAPSYTVAQILAAANNSTDTAAATSLLNNYYALVNSYKGTILQNSPKYSGTLTYEHTFKFSGGATLAPRLNVTYKDKYWAQGGGPAPAGYTSATTALAQGSIVRQDAYELYDFYTTWSNADSKFTVTGYVKNLQNKVIQTNITGGGLTFVSINDPRTFGLILNANF